MGKRHLYTVVTLAVNSGHIEASAEVALADNENELLGAAYRMAGIKYPGCTVDVRVGRVKDAEFLKVLRQWAKES